MILYPAQLTCHTGVTSGISRFSTATRTPRDNTWKEAQYELSQVDCCLVTNDGVVATLINHQGATAVSKARTLACVSGTDHVGSDPLGVCWQLENVSYGGGMEISNWRERNTFESRRDCFKVFKMIYIQYWNEGSKCQVIGSDKCRLKIKTFSLDYLITYDVSLSHLA